MADSRATWKDDDKLIKAMTKIVHQGLKRISLKRGFSEYPWRMRTLDRRLRHSTFPMTMRVLKSKTAVENELKGAGKFFRLPSYAQRNLARVWHKCK